MLLALIMALAQEMPVAAAAKLVGEHDTRLWRIIHWYVNVARTKLGFSEVRRVGVDETAAEGATTTSACSSTWTSDGFCSAPKGERKRLSVASLKTSPLPTGVIRMASTRDGCCDMSPAFIAGVTEALRNAEIIFDRFHIMKLMQEALDKV